MSTENFLMVETLFNFYQLKQISEGKVPCYAFPYEVTKLKEIKNEHKTLKSRSDRHQFFSVKKEIVC